MVLVTHDAADQVAEVFQDVVQLRIGWSARVFQFQHQAMGLRANDFVLVVQAVDLVRELGVNVHQDLE